MSQGKLEADRQIIQEGKARGGMGTFLAYVKLSGPGWLQSAITLGGGSLASSLYLGVLAGFALMWLQPLAMFIGIIMLSAIAYVTLSTGEKPFQAINKHINPVLGWGWLIATLMANCVWSLPQYALATAAIQQNLMPGVFGEGAMNMGLSKGLIVTVITILCIFIVYLYDSKGVGYKIFNLLLKFMVGGIVICFFGVVITMTVKGALNWGGILGGLIPDITLLWSPADTFTPHLEKVGEFSGFWSEFIVSQQVDVLVAAAATAVGINMTFLLPYSMLKRGWNKDFRGLAVFDLSTGLLIPFVLATGCVVIASASQYHTKPAVRFATDECKTAVAELTASAEYAAMSDDQKKATVRKHLAYEDDTMTARTGETLLPDVIAGNIVELTAGKAFQGKDEKGKRAALDMAMMNTDGKALGGYKKNAIARIKHEIGAEAYNARLKEAGDQAKAEESNMIAALPLADRSMASMLVKRDNMHLATALAPLTGKTVAQYVFGIGVVGMAFSSIIILMLINGFCICEMVGRPSEGWLYRIGCTIPAIGLLGPFIWGDAAPYLAIPTSVFGFILIPIAYLSFTLLVNRKKLLGDDIPKGGVRTVWNILMILGVLLVGFGAVTMVCKKLGTGLGLSIIIGYGLLALIVHFVRKGKADDSPATPAEPPAATES